MATGKKDQSKELATVVTKETFVELVNSSDLNNPEEMKGLHVSAMLVKNEELEQIAGNDFIDLKDGETYILLVTGIDKQALTDLADETKTKDCVNLTNLENGKEHISGDVVMVSTINKMQARGTEFPFTIKVYVDGEKKGKNGKYKNLQIWKY